MQELEARIKLSTLYARPGIDDLSRFDTALPFERLVKYWQRMINARYDPVTGIATAEIRAYSPQDAKLVASTLVTLAEELVNRIAMRAKLDTVRFAENEVKRAEDRLKQARGALTDFRIQEGVIDPTSSVVTGNTKDVSAVRAALIALTTEYAALQKGNVSASSPLAVNLQARISATRDQLSRLESEVAKDRDGNSTLTSVVARFEQLDLDRQYAQSMLLSTMQALDQARAAAGSQQLYLTPYVNPALPASSTYPNRPLAVALVVVCAVGIWFVFLLAWRALRAEV